MVKVQVNFTKVERAATAAFRESCYLLGREFTLVISEKGAFPDHPDRDLIDTGALRASQQIRFPKPGEAVYSWNTAYTLYQHEGFTRRDGTQWKGRPWTKIGMQRFDLYKTYCKLLEAKLQ